MKPTHQITLLYQAIASGRYGPKARAVALGRETAQQVVVFPKWDIVQLRPGARVSGGHGEERFWKRSGRKVGGLDYGWQIESVTPIPTIGG